MSACPTLFAFTIPVSSTSATAGLVLDQSNLMPSIASSLPSTAMAVTCCRVPTDILSLLPLTCKRRAERCATGLAVGFELFKFLNHFVTPSVRPLVSRLEVIERVVSLTVSAPLAHTTQGCVDKSKLTSNRPATIGRALKRLNLLFIRRAMLCDKRSF